MNRTQRETVAAFLANPNGGPVDEFIERFVDSAVAALEADYAAMREGKVMLDTWGLDIIEKLGQLVREASCGDPLTTCIECRVGDDETVPIVWLWATADEKQPVVRIRELAEENQRLRDRQRVLFGDESALTPDSGTVLVDVDKLRKIEWIKHVSNSPDPSEDVFEEA